MPDVAPHFVLAPTDATLGTWELFDGDGWVTLPEELAEWDPLTDLLVRRTVGLDLAAARTSTGLSDDRELRWSVWWRAGDSHLCPISATTFAAEESAILQVTLPGAELGASVDLRTRLVLADEGLQSAPGVAWRAGSVLLDDSQRINLIGSMAQFPVAVIDFEAAGLDPDASFVLDIPESPSMPVLGALQLLVNSRDERLVRALAGSGRKDPASLELVSQMEEGVFAMLLDHATELDRADLLAGADWEEDTLGRALVMLTARAERSRGLAGLVQLRDTEPAKYRAAVVGEARRQGVGRAL